jgi:ribosomal protein S18 acetylase RimI-like enzyme
MLSAVPNTPETSDYISVGRHPFALRLATPDDLHEVRWLVGEATAWLRRTKDTDQWMKPWPNREARDQRLLAGLENRETWIVWDGQIPAATVTLATRPNPAAWSEPSPDCDLSERAVYAQRLITARRYAGMRLGTELIDWAGLRGQRQYGAKWIRIDVWSSNTELHEYYKKNGFRPCGTCADPDYPSGALFQKPVSAIREPVFPQFTECPTDLIVSSCSGLTQAVIHYDRPRNARTIGRAQTRLFGC